MVTQAAPTGVDVLEARGGTCRDRLRQVLEALDGRRGVPHSEVIEIVQDSRCPQGHELYYATLMNGLIEVEEHGGCRLGRPGRDWLDAEGWPSPDWQASTEPGAPPLREWQTEALSTWADHGRHGVVEAVTGTGKSRVGVEATREALAHDYSVLIVVPTRDLVDQWAASLRMNRVPGVGVVGEDQPPRFGHRRVLVGTVQALYNTPPTRADGKVLLIADECHRYGAGQWRQVLHPDYRRRLGLTATFERNDDGLTTLLDYFGGPPVYRIGFDRAIADGVVAHYDVKLHGVALYPRERADYDQAHETVVDCRLRLLAAGFPDEPFGLFLYRVQEAAEDRTGREDPTIVDTARRYLKAFSQRVEIMSSAAAKMDAVRQLAPRVEESSGALLFTRTVAAAEEMALVLDEEGVASSAIHSKLTRRERRERLAALKAGRLQAVAAPTVLDEGVDVPVIDLAVVLGGSKSRRQMIQRMGRVLRLKPDNRSATFIVVYAKNTVEDLTIDDGREGCLDLIVASADSVEHGEDSLRVAGPAPATEPETSQSGAPEPTHADQLPPSPVVAEPPERPEPAPSNRNDLDLSRVSMTRAVLTQYQRAHGGSDTQAEADLRETLEDLDRLGTVSFCAGHQPVHVFSTSNIEVSITPDRFVRYRCGRDDGLAWPELKSLLLRSRSAREPYAWTERPWPTGSTQHRVRSVLATLGPLSELQLGDSAVQDHCQTHGPSQESAERNIRLLQQHLETDRDRCQTLPGGVVVARSGYQLTIDVAGRAVVGYDSSGQTRSYEDYLDFGRADGVVQRPRMLRPEKDSPLEIEAPNELGEYVDFTSIHYDAKSFDRLAPLVDRGWFNRWDCDRAIRHLMVMDIEEATAVSATPSGAHRVRGREVEWLFRPDGLSVRATPHPESAPAGDASSSPGSDLATQIERLAELKDRGYLTDEEFAAAKARVLS